MEVYKTKKKMFLVKTHAFDFLMTQVDTKAPLPVFCNFVVTLIKKQEQDLTELGFKTTASWITDMLREIR